MVRERRETLLREEEQEKIRTKGKSKNHFQVDDDDDEEDLDVFENDGFIVDDAEDDEEEEGENPKQTQKKKKKRKSLKSIVLDDEDLELIRENESINQETLRDGKFKRLRKAGVDSERMEYSSDDEGSLFDDIAEDESNDDDDMADFIVDEEVVNYEKGDSLRQKKFNDMKHLSSLSNEDKHSFGKVGRLEEHSRKVQIQATKSSDPNQYKSFIPTNMYVAGEDKCVDDTDIPERMQIIQDIVGSPIDRMSIEEESSWILSQLASNINPLFSEAKSCRLVNTAKREHIISFLELHHKRKYDIPFIAMYRKEQCLSLLEDPKPDESENMLLNDIERKSKLKWHKMLWIIKELDTKWLLLQKRKSMLLRYYNKQFEQESQMSFLVEGSSFRKKIFDSITNMLKKAETEREIDDIDRKFNLHFPPVEKFFDSGYKRPLTKSYYSNCNKAGLWSLARKFGNLEKFGSSFSLKKVGIDHEEDPQESPEEIASIYKCETFQTSEATLKGARHMAAMMLSSEIPFRKYVRTIFMDKALVSTSPTLEGNKTIDSFHEFAGVKWLRDKPLSKFEDSQWLFIQKAEEEKLLQVKIQLPDHTINELTMTCNDAYLKDIERISTRLWNEQRKLILQDAISNFLLPSMEKEARALLSAKAKNCLLMKYAMQLWNRVSVAPYLNKESGTAQDHGIMACCWGNGKPGTTFVMLDSGGELVDVMHARSLTLRSQNINDQQSRKNDQQRVLKFLTNCQPHVIVLGAANASCLRLREDINEIISMMSEHNIQNFSQGMKGLPAVVLGEEGLPRLYEDSEISMSQLPRQPGIVKRAVALGRYLLNPLAMVATLCGVENEVVSWKLNPLERFLTSDEKLEIIEWIMTDVTNQVGMDINLAIRHDWLLAPLQFVSGLGPKKATILRRELLGAIDVRNRRDFAKFGLNTKKVFCNAVGFLRISCNDENFVDSVGNTLDRTRIHPESYNFAEELARAVYRQQVLENLEANATQVNAIECIQNDPNLIKYFDLNEYADRLEIEKGEYKRVTLFDIKMELLHGFKDPRRPYTVPTQEEEFYMITGETGDVLVEGKIVRATVRHVLPQQAFCVLDSGMTGVLFKDDFSDETEIISLTNKLNEGAVLTCKIKLIDKNRCRVNLTCKVSELKNDSEQSFHDKDPYYHQGNIISLSQLEGTDKMKLGNKHFVPRMISHPNFQNITADQAKQFLADQEVGEYIFHPSSRGPCYLTLSLKIFNGVYVHKDIAEGGKSHNIKNLLGLGETLKVGEETFEDINQVIERYVNPLVVHLKAMINFRKFKKGSKAEVDKLLKLEKDEYPNRIPYGFGISYEHPGTFILSYFRSTNPHHEFVAIHPKGFKFRKQIFKNIEQLVAYFQNHIYDNVAPAKSCIAVGSFRESMSGGWRCNNVDQHTESIAYNDHGNGCDAGRGHRRGSRGRGFGPRYGSGDPPDDSFAAGKRWEGRGSGEGNGGRQGRGRGSGGSQGNRQGRVPWGGNSYESGRHAHGGYSDSNNDSGWGQGQDQGRGRGRRGSQGNGRGRGRWGRNNSNEERNRYEDSSREKGSCGLSVAGNAGSGNENLGWSVAHGKNATPSGDESGWGGTGGKSW
ncbi:Transcription elongation factor SPT6 [Spatholobus suberectus]|nr:Transcription elongation factor SPT6 [Spatholobus suberectus]